MRSGYKGKDPAVRAGDISSKQEFKNYCKELRDLETDATIRAKVFTYDQILEEVQKLINDDTLHARDKLAAIKLLGSGKTITAWKEVQDLNVNAHESFVTDDADRSPTFPRRRAISPIDLRVLDFRHIRAPRFTPSFWA